MDLAGATDADLIGLARAGDRDAFGMLYLRHHSAGWRVASVVAGWSPDAEVALIEGFTMVFSALPVDLDGPVDFRRYLLACVRQAALDRLAASRQRRLQGPPPFEPVQPEPDEVVLSGLEHHLLRSALLALPERRRTALWLTDVEAMTPNEIGGILNLEPAVVTGLAAGAREEVRGTCLQVHQQAEVRAGCRFTVDHLGSYLDGRMGLPERTLIKGHIDRCTPCRMRRAEFANLASGLAAAAPVVPLLGGECQHHWRLHAPTVRPTLTLLEPAQAAATLARPRRRSRLAAIPMPSLSSLAAVAAAIAFLLLMPRPDQPADSGPRETVLASPTFRAKLPDVPLAGQPTSTESPALDTSVATAPADGAVPPAQTAGDSSGPTVVQFVAARTSTTPRPAPAFSSARPKAVAVRPKPVALLPVSPPPDAVAAAVPAAVIPASVSSVGPASPPGEKAPKPRRQPQPDTEMAMAGEHKHHGHQDQNDDQNQDGEQDQNWNEARADRNAGDGQSGHRSVRA
jgi:DNA-directed RNA polymerase specialized sigma24 family protein